MNMKSTAMLLVLGVLLTAGIPFGQAQNKHLLLEEITIDASKRQQFEDAQRDYCAAVVRGGAPTCIVLSPTVFARHDQYLVLLAFSSFAHYDEGTYTSKGLTPDQAKERTARREPVIRHNDESAFEQVFSSGSAMSQKTKLIEITELQLHPGFEQVVANYLRSQRATSGFAIYRCNEGCDRFRFFVYRYISSLPNWTLFQS